MTSVFLIFGPTRRSYELIFASIRPSVAHSDPLPFHENSRKLEVANHFWLKIHMQLFTWIWKNP